MTEISGQNSKTAVIGAGAIGGITAAFMTDAGWNLTLVCKHKLTLDIAAGPGLHIFGARGHHTIKVPSVRTIADLAGPLDLVFLAVKATDMIEAVQELLPLLHPESMVVSLQNGICEESLAMVLGRQRVVGCVVGFGATMHEPGELEMTSSGEFVIGNLDHRPDPRLEPLKKMMSDVVPTRVSNNIMGELYSKLVINSCITTLGGVCGLTLGAMMGKKKIRRLFLAIMREAMAVADKLGLKVEPAAGGKLDYYQYLDGDGWLEDFKRHLMLRLIGFKYRRLKSSTLQSLERGKEPETAYLNGYIVDKGRQLGVPTPVNQALVRMIEEIVVGRRRISLANIDELSA